MLQKLIDFLRRLFGKGPVAQGGGGAGEEKNPPPPPEP